VLGRLFLLFTLVPLAELYLLVTIGGLVGLAPTIALIVVTGMFGAWLAKREGRKALAGYQDAMTQGRPPEDGILSGLLILVGGVLLITPGILTDVAGFALMIPPIRHAIAKRVARRVERRINSGELSAMYLVTGPASSSVGSDAVVGGAGFGMPGDVGGCGASIVDVEVVDGDRGAE
jgi:UPF0716 protein FxsA